MCFAGSIRDVILMKNFDLLSVIGGLFVVMLIYNIATGNFILGFDTPGIIAHSDHLWNILGMYTVGFAATLAGGCPLRQLVLAGQGSSDAGAGQPVSPVRLCPAQRIRHGPAHPGHPGLRSLSLAPEKL